MKTTLISTVAGLALSASAIAGGGAAITFDNGPEGWSINGQATIVPEGGNPGAHLRHVQTDTFGCNIRTDSNTDFVTDFTQTGPVRITVDFKVNSITFFGSEVPRDIVLELRDYDVDGPYPYNSVWFLAGELPAPGEGWVTYEFIIDNVNDTELPAGWGGTGDEDPDTFEPILPENRTWTDMLQSIDEVQFTTFVPGFFYGFTNYDFEVDNITITPLEPDCPADVDGSGTVDLADLNLVLGSFGQTTDSGDTNGDGVVDLADLNAILGAFGQACP
ncbi:MAG: GC-type dockerin domain-anchored protein [Phycisphaerales bacterium]